MKQLRILTGAHAGAQIRLTPGDYRVGPDDAADICITDWNESSIWISIDEASVTRWCHAVPIAESETTSGSENSSGNDPVVTLMQDLVPVPFNNIVICIGPEDQPWPSDVEILRTLWIKEDTPGKAVTARRPGNRLIGLALGIGMVGALLVAGATLFSAQLSSANPSPQQLAWRIKTALRSAGFTELQTTPRGGEVVVTGMVATAADDVAVRSIFEHIAKDPEQVQRHYNVAEDDRRNLEDALGIVGIHVKYAGAGVFKISGTVPSMTQFDAALTRVKGDLNPNIKRIDVAVTEGPSNIQYSQAIGLGDVRYIETPDGVKHLYADETADDASGEPQPSDPTLTQSKPQPPAQGLAQSAPLSDRSMQTAAALPPAEQTVPLPSKTSMPPSH